jgi:hypothetical protein
MADTEAVTRASAIAAIGHVAQNNCGSREREAEEMLVAASAAVAQEPFAWHVCGVNADGSLSLEHAAQWEEAAHEHINDAITEHEIESAGSWVVRPAYHRPQPSPAAQNDAPSQSMRDVLAEVERATRKFPTWPTDPLHALAVLGEEFGELTKDMLQLTYESHKTSADNVRTEALQTAAMALRLFMSLDRYDYRPGVQHSQGVARAAQEGQ